MKLARKLMLTMTLCFIFTFSSFMPAFATDEVAPQGYCNEIVNTEYFCENGKRYKVVSYWQDCDGDGVYDFVRKDPAVYVGPCPI